MITIDRNHSAVLVMDFQSQIVAMLGDRAAGLLAQAHAVIARARSAKVPVIYVVVGFRPGYPEVSSRNLSFSAALKSGGFLETSGADIPAPVHPEPGEVVVVKHRVNAFAGTDLEMILRAKTVDTLILMGIATSGVVLSTVRHAADADYRVLIVKDACADRDDEVHRVLIEKVFVRQTTVVSASEICDALDAE
jgi:nicotinamidase-related amidase